uniref:Uncharacterized protein n=1 Tax=Mycena chlorophos TaxID=658473 RepID=A0ABQ0KXJ1_MYCCL|nr:predicted protein [Mycena chlorophos]
MRPFSALLVLALLASNVAFALPIVAQDENFHPPFKSTRTVHLTVMCCTSASARLGLHLGLNHLELDVDEREPPIRRAGKPSTYSDERDITLLRVDGFADALVEPNAVNSVYIRADPGHTPFRTPNLYEGPVDETRKRVTQSQDCIVVDGPLAYIEGFSIPSLPSLHRISLKLVGLIVPLLSAAPRPELAHELTDVKPPLIWIVASLLAPTAFAAAFCSPTVFRRVAFYNSLLAALIGEAINQYPSIWWMAGSNVFAKGAFGSLTNTPMSSLSTLRFDITKTFPLATTFHPESLEQPVRSTTIVFLQALRRPFAPRNYMYLLDHYTLLHLPLSPLKAAVQSQLSFTKQVLAVLKRNLVRSLRGIGRTLISYLPAFWAIVLSLDIIAFSVSPDSAAIKLFLEVLTLRRQFSALLSDSSVTCFPTHQSKTMCYLSDLLEPARPMSSLEYFLSEMTALMGACLVFDLSSRLEAKIPLYDSPTAPLIAILEASYRLTVGHLVPFVLFASRLVLPAMLRTMHALWGFMFGWLCDDLRLLAQDLLLVRLHFGATELPQRVPTGPELQRPQLPPLAIPDDDEDGAALANQSGSTVRSPSLKFEGADEALIGAVVPESHARLPSISSSGSKTLVDIDVDIRVEYGKGFGPEGMRKVVKKVYELDGLL